VILRTVRAAWDCRAVSIAAFSFACRFFAVQCRAVVRVSFGTLCGCCTDFELDGESQPAHLDVQGLYRVSTRTVAGRGCRVELVFVFVALRRTPGVLVSLFLYLLVVLCVVCVRLDILAFPLLGRHVSLSVFWFRTFLWAVSGSPTLCVWSLG